MNNLEQPHIVNHNFKRSEMKKNQKKIPLVQVGGKKGVHVAIGTDRKLENFGSELKVPVAGKKGYQYQTGLYE